MSRKRRLSFLHVYHHATVVVIGPGCSGIWGWCFDAVFIASLLFLFLDFHAKNYKDGDGDKSKNKVKADHHDSVKQA
ncbi:hypothetical protein LINGRAHAP2_LOCUS24372 [Linum grandiflorum]